MGGMYTEMLTGYDRILVNPAFEMGDTMSKFTGKQVFQNPRQDGVQEFMVTKGLIKEYQEMTTNNFSSITDEERERVVGLFGDADPVVHTFDLFLEHYPTAIRFHGEHRLNDSILLHSVLPVVRWIDDAQSQRQRELLYISIEQTIEREGRPLPSVQKAYEELLNHYDIYFVASLPANDVTYGSRWQEWVFETFGVASYHHLILTNRKDLLYGDFLIDATTANGSTGFMSTRIEFGSAAFKTWDDVRSYFSLMHGD